MESDSEFPTNLPPRGHGAITPADQGQTVYREHYPLGADGCLIRHVDRSEPPSADTWTLHDWTYDEPYDTYAPWNGVIGCEDEGLDVSPAKACRMLEDNCSMDDLRAIAK